MAIYMIIQRPKNQMDASACIYFVEAKNKPDALQKAKTDFYMVRDRNPAEHYAPSVKRVWAGDSYFF